MSAPDPADLVDIEPSWKAALAEEFRQPYFQALRGHLYERYDETRVFPPGKLIFNAYWQTPLPAVKVVILGQDPYHHPGQAHGLCFSVRRGMPKPPSLINIFKELEAELGCSPPPHGELLHWAQQGVFLLNTFLTVEERRPASHRDIGWEPFTDATIRTLNREHEGLVFLLWGNFARKKAQLVDKDRHHILEAAHPAPLSANKGFFGCEHFRLANEWLRKQGREEIDWCIPAEEA